MNTFSIKLTYKFSSIATRKGGEHINTLIKQIRKNLLSQIPQNTIQLSQLNSIQEQRDLISYTNSQKPTVEKQK